MREQDSGQLVFVLLTVECRVTGVADAGFSAGHRKFSWPQLAFTPQRPYNAVTHVGKLYSVLATRIASAIVANIRGVIDSECVLVSQIGRPVSDPGIVDVRLASGDDRIMSTALKHQTRDIVQTELGRLPELRDALLHERVSLF